MQGKSISEGHIMQGNKSLNEVRIHPTQKPIVLYDWIFQNFAKPGQKVLDTHLGSGSSRIAAYEAGVDFIGFEIDPFYFKTQEERFANYTNQTSHIGTPDLAVRIATDVATALFLLWGILNHYAKKEAEEAFLEVSKEAHYWKMVANHRRDMLDKTRENLYKWHGSRKS